MFRCIVGGVLLGLTLSSPLSAGYYTSIDTLRETRWDRDFKAFNENILLPLGFIAADKGQLIDSPMRQRYLQLDAMGRDGAVKLNTWQQKLNYSAVLIRRGKAYEAIPVLQRLSGEQPDNFLVWAHLGTVNFLSGNPEFRSNAADCLRQSLHLWPASLEKLEPDMQQFLKQSQLENDFELERFRKIETYFKDLVRSRVLEDNLAKKKLPVPDGVDPIFLDEQSKEAKKPPVSFLNEEGKFDVGRIARVEKAKLPQEAVEYVEQLLIWMPTDQRLLWLLGEVTNASVTDYKEDKDRNKMFRSALRIFQKLDSLENPPTFAKAITERRKALAAHVESLPEENVIDPKQFGLDKDRDPTTETPLSGADWWRTLAVGFITGLAVGMFAIWQIQEMRRRRQRSA